LSGFLAFRATAVIRVLINPQPFQQGRLLLHYFPQGQINIKRRQCANSSLTLRTQLPRVELDCETTNEAILEMPYVSPTTHYNLIDGTGPIGQFMLCVYSPLFVGAGADGVNYTVYCSFKDIDLCFPTIPYASEALARRRRERRLLEIGALEAQSGKVWTAQAKGVKKNAGRGQEGDGPSDAEEKALGSGGPVSLALSTVGKVATAFGDVPLISSIAKPVAWAAGIGSKIASAFGWSSPRCTGDVQKVLNERFWQMQNYNNLDKSATLGLDAGNKIRELPGFAGTDIDEMSLDYVNRIPAYIGNFNWQTTDENDQSLFTIPISPIECGTARSISNGTTTVAVTDYAPFAYVANFFQYWRGSITYSFKVMKTKFHSGRLIVSFQPGTTDALDTGSRSYLYREIFDLQESGEFKITIPWVSTTQWKKIIESTGVLTVQVLNPLVAVDAVETDVDILVEACAGPDFQLALPNSEPSQLPIVTTDVGSSFASKKSSTSFVLTKVKKNRYQAQSAFGDIWTAQVEGGMVVENTHTSTIMTSDAPIASSDLNSAGLSAAEFCIGEAVTSLRQLIKRFSMWHGTGANSASVFYRPGQMMVPYIQTGSPIVQGGFHADWFQIFGSLFAYRRGSSRLKFGYAPGSNQANNDCTIVPYLLYDSSGTNTNGYTSRGLQGACAQHAYFRDAATGGAEIELPHYGRTHMYCNFADLATPVSGDSIYRDLNSVYIRGSSNFNAATKNGVRCERAAGDDCSFGFFVGVLPLTATANVQFGSYGTW
jgi:hypothetical protein